MAVESQVRFLHICDYESELITTWPEFTTAFTKDTQKMWLLYQGTFYLLIDFPIEKFHKKANFLLMGA